MRFEKIQSRVQSVHGGYALSATEWESPQHQAMRGLQEALIAGTPKRFVAALAQIKAVGLNANELRLQPSPESWFNLAPYLISRGTAAQKVLLDVLIADPDTRFNDQRSCPKAMRRKDRPFEGGVVRPFGHSFLSGWGAFFDAEPPGDLANKRSDRARDYERHKIADQLRSSLTERGIDWSLADSRGNTLAHELFRSCSGPTCEAWVPWLANVGVDLARMNDQGLSAIDIARKRLAKNQSSLGIAPLAGGSKTQQQLDSYQWALSCAEDMALNASLSTQPVKPSAKPRASRL